MSLVASRDPSTFGRLRVVRKVTDLRIAAKIGSYSTARNLIASDLAIRSIEQGDPRTRLSDGDGLFLLLSVNGGSHGWRFNDRFGGKRKMLSLGTCPDRSLALARRKGKRAEAGSGSPRAVAEHSSAPR